MLTASGVNVIDLGMCSTPLQYFSIRHLELDGGVMITGSHNPPEFNGLKLSVGKETIFGSRIQDIRKLTEEDASTGGEGSARTHDIHTDYFEYIKPRFGSLEGIKVVVDGGNGTGGMDGPALMRALGAEVVELFCEPDGNFPNGVPNPLLPENRTAAIAAVREHGADLGLGWDGDFMSLMIIGLVLVVTGMNLSKKG